MQTSVQHLIDQIHRQVPLSVSAFRDILDHATEDDHRYAADLARAVAQQNFGKAIYVRGLIEFTNYCKNGCYYCGLRSENRGLERYRLDEEEIYEACERGYQMGCRTFVLQGGEDPAFTTVRLATIVRHIRATWPDCAITLSCGEKTEAEYRELFEAGADRYLLREETSSPELYGRLHPPSMSFEERIDCLQTLKRIGFQAGGGFLVGTPGQTNADLAQDLFFMQSFQPAMCGIGPFLPQSDTPFADCPPGDYKTTLFLISLLRLILPYGLLPATTAIGSLVEGGREAAILAGANVVMPNVSPLRVRGQYALYDNKSELLRPGLTLDDLFKDIGYHTVCDRGDFKG